MSGNERAALGFNICRERSWFATPESDAFTLYCRAHANGSIVRTTGIDWKMIQNNAYLDLQHRTPGGPPFKRERGQHGAKFFMAALLLLQAVYNTEQAASSHPATKLTA